ncbi:MAG TPA: hypothetical protein VFW06_09195 [Acidimicrobiia bacterium]|nr:hypothetical protein [Acidimicrobiia bacterium]
MKPPSSKAKSASRDVADAVRLVARDFARPLRSLTGTARAVGGSGAVAAARLRDATTTALRSLPREALPEIGKSLYALRRIRTPAQANAVVETEVERLLTIVTPLLVAHPLPLQRDASARAILAAAGGLAAAGEEAEALTALVSAGTTVPATLPVVIGANLVALSVEIYVAASLRVHDIEAAGFEPDPRQVASDVIAAMTGSTTASGRVTRHATRAMVKMVTARLLARWGAGFVPVAGVAYSGWDAQRTVAAVRALPLPGTAASADAEPVPVAPSPVDSAPGSYALPS